VSSSYIVIEIKNLFKYQINILSSLLVTYDGSTKSADCESLQLVDVRIIDFAHSTHKGLKDSTLHFGPDEGFIYGIENFITILEEIKFPRG